MKIDLLPGDQWYVRSETNRCGIMQIGDSTLTNDVQAWMEEHAIRPAIAGDGWRDYRLHGDLEVLFKLRWL